MKIVFILLLVFCSLVDCCSQTYTCNLVSTSNFGSDMKPSKSVIQIDDNIVSISNFFDGGKGTMLIEIDSIREKEYNYEMCKWYYGKCDGRKDIVIVPPKSYLNNFVHLFDFADEVTVFNFTFFYKK